VVLEILGQHAKQELFDRIAKYVVTQVPDAPEAILESQVLGEMSFARWDPEYQDLIRDAFKKLGQEPKNKILDWIRSGPTAAAGADGDQDNSLKKFWQRSDSSPYGSTSLRIASTSSLG
jgi:hypothetical protein